MKQLLVFLLFLCSVSVFAQDEIVKKDGSTIVCRVVELTDSEITYKKWSDLNGSNYVMNRADASAINYANGKKVNLSEATNLYTPNNQNDGTQQYNDRALLNMAYGDVTPKVKRLKTIAWIGGGVLAATSIAFFIAGHNESGVMFDFSGDGGTSIAGACFLVGGVAWTTGFLAAANHVNNSNLYSSSIIYKDIPLSNGSSLSLGADLLRDNMHGQNILGLGLRYNF